MSRPSLFSHYAKLMAHHVLLLVVIVGVASFVLIAVVISVIPVLAFRLVPSSVVALLPWFIVV